MLNLCAQYWALGFLLPGCTPWSLEEKTWYVSFSMSPSNNISNVFIFCLNILLLACCSSHPTCGPIFPLVSWWSYIAENWNRKPHIQGDLSLMWNSLLTWTLRSRNPKLFQNSYYKTDNQMPPNHNILYSINRTLTESFCCICISK